MLSPSRPFLAAFLALVVMAASYPAAAASWSKLSPADSPDARSYVSMAYDPVSQKVVLFGGYDGNHLNDTWTFDGTTWTKVTTQSAPRARAAAGLAYDRVLRKLVLYGGYAGGGVYLSDTWLWDGATSQWTQAHPRHTPSKTTEPSVFTDPKNGHVDVYGGYDGHFYQLDTWQFIAGDWKKFNTQTSPLARSAAIVATNPATKSTVLYGGLGDIRTDNTWTFDGSDWTQQFPNVQPTNRYGAGAAYDPALKSVIAFGGAAGGAGMNDSWAWTGGNQWKGMNPSNKPPGREGMGMTYDQALGHIIVFGGESSGNLLRDTWELIP